MSNEGEQGLIEEWWVTFLLGKLLLLAEEYHWYPLIGDEWKFWHIANFIIDFSSWVSLFPLFELSRPLLPLLVLLSCDFSRFSESNWKIRILASSWCAFDCWIQRIRCRKVWKWRERQEIFLRLGLPGFSRTSSPRMENFLDLKESSEWNYANTFLIMFPPMWPRDVLRWPGRYGDRTKIRRSARKKNPKNWSHTWWDCRTKIIFRCAESSFCGLRKYPVLSRGKFKGEPIWRCKHNFWTIFWRIFWNINVS